MSDADPSMYCPNCGREVCADAAGCSGCPANFEGPDAWKPVALELLSKAVGRERAARLEQAKRVSRRPAGPHEVMPLLIVGVFLIVGIFVTVVFGIVGAMSASNMWQWLTITVLPTGVVPAVYFLAVHGTDPDSRRAYLGIGAAVHIFFVSLMIVFGGIGVMRALVTIGAPMDGQWPGYLFLLVLLTVQFLMFRHFRRRLIRGMQDNREGP